MHIYVGNNRPCKKESSQPDMYELAKRRMERDEKRGYTTLHDFIGCITISNPATGQHRTFRIRRQPDNAQFAPGQRVVSLLTGPDNESDYQGFGFVTAAGHICLWKKQRDSKTYLAFRNMLEDPRRYEDSHGLEYATEKRCCRCFRKLTDPASITAGMGPECRQKG